MRIKKLLMLLISVSFIGGFFAVSPVSAGDHEQYYPIPGYRVGPYAPGGTGLLGGIIDYLKMLNARDGGINGVKITWTECETEYKTDRAVECYHRLKKNASLINPFSTGATYALIEPATKDQVPILSLGYGRTDASDGRVFPYVFPAITNYWNQNTAKIKFIGQKSGGMGNLKGMKIVNLHHGSGYGRETIPILDIQAEKYGFSVTHVEVPHPGIDQQSQWLQIRRLKPDWVILRGWGVMNPTAIKTAAKFGFPRDHMLGVWWSGAEEDVRPAGKSAVGYYAAGFHPSGADTPLHADVKKYVYDRNNGDLKDPSRFGTIYHNRGMITAIIMTESVRTAMGKYGNKRMTGAQVQWGLEHLDLTDARIAELGATGFIAPLKITCLDHEGGGGVKFQQWDGKKWQSASDWIKPDHALTRPLIEASAAKYAKEKGLTLRDCSKV